MTMAVSISLLVLAAALWGVALILDNAGRTRLAAVLGVAGAVVFAAMLAVLPGVDMRPDPAVPGPLASTTPKTGPTPAPVPSYDPATCADLAWLDGQWKCIPFEEQG